MASKKNNVIPDKRPKYVLFDKDGWYKDPDTAGIAIPYMWHADDDAMAIEDAKIGVDKWNCRDKCVLVSQDKDGCFTRVIQDI